jgi:hypothetical protein
MFCCRGISLRGWALQELRGVTGLGIEVGTAVIHKMLSSIED